MKKLLSLGLMGFVALHSTVLLAPPKKSNRSEGQAVPKKAAPKKAATKKTVTKVSAYDIQVSDECKAQLLGMIKKFDANVVKDLVDPSLRKALNSLEAYTKEYAPERIEFEFRIKKPSFGQAIELVKSIFSGVKIPSNIKYRIDPMSLLTQPHIIVDAEFGLFARGLGQDHGIASTLDWPKMLGVKVNRETLEFEDIESLPLSRVVPIISALSDATEECFQQTLGTASIQNVLGLELIPGSIQVLKFDGKDITSGTPEDMQNAIESIIPRLSNLVKKLNGSAAIRKQIYDACKAVKEVLTAQAFELLKDEGVSASSAHTILHLALNGVNIRALKAVLEGNIENSDAVIATLKKFMASELAEKAKLSKAKENDFQRNRYDNTVARIKHALDTLEVPADEEDSDLE